MASRWQNERRFGTWLELANGARRYERTVAGAHRGHAKYYKEVDANENTIRFWQEIFDDRGNVIERHEKLPHDQGHQKV